MAKGLTIPVSIPKQQTGNQQFSVLLFSRDGKFIDRKPVSGGKAQFDDIGLPPTDLRVFILPSEIPGIERARNIDAILKFKPYEPVLGFEKDRLIIKPIPEQFFDWWKIKICNVRGTVRKWFNLYGAAGFKGICRARVHICEVDKLIWWIEKLPPEVIRRIPDIILKPELPTPIPIPRPIPIDRIKIDRILIRPRFAEQPNAFDATGINEITANRLKVLPTIKDEVKKQLLTGNLSIIKKTLLDNFNLFHPYFCYHPWFWPYLYRYDELATVYTDVNGRFDTNIFYVEGGDIPDLYFWIEALIDGVWTTVYRPSVPCHTWWDYKCGTEVTLTVTDPRVTWDCQQMLPGEIVWVKTIGHGASVSRIQQTPLVQPSDNTPAVPYQRIGLADFSEAGDFKNPFGTSLYFILQFSSGLPKSSIAYYKWKYCRTHNADMQVLVASPTDADFTEMSNPISKGYTFEYTDPVTGIKHFDSKAVSLGPVSVGTTQRLYRIPPTNPAMAPFNVPESSPFWDQNTVAMSFDSNSLDGDGLYEFRLELYNSAGAKMTTLPKSIFQVPHAATFTPSVVAPDVMQTDDTATQTAGFNMRIRINNQRCEAAVYKVLLNGTEASADCCGFVKYGNLNADLQLSFKAMHPHQHADFRFTVQKGTCSDSVMTAATNASAEVSGHTNGYLRDANGIYRKTFKPPVLLGTCNSGKAAFAEFVYVNALHTNGNSMIDGYDASASAAFALEP